MNEQTKIKRKMPYDSVIFDLLILCVFLIFTVGSFRYNPRARSIPLFLGAVGSLMTLMQLIVDAFPRTLTILRFIGEGGLLSEKEKTESQDIEGGKESNAENHEIADRYPEESSKQPVWTPVFRLFLWLLGFIVVLIFTNYLIAVAAFVILLTKMEAKESWKKSVTLGLCIDAAFFVLFEIILQAQL